MFLTIEELKQLTDRKRKAGVIAWLRERRYPFEIGESGWPKVLRSYVQDKLGGAPEATEPQLHL